MKLLVVLASRLFRKVHVRIHGFRFRRWYLLLSLYIILGGCIGARTWTKRVEHRSPSFSQESGLIGAHRGDR